MSICGICQREDKRTQTYREIFSEGLTTLPDYTIIVATHERGSRLYRMDQVKIRFEFESPDGAEVVVKGDCGCDIEGRINYIDLEALEQYSFDEGVNVRTGEPDSVGMKRIMEKTKRLFEQHQVKETPTD